jgi:UDPglucose--hexose-1-phosphate uridylyltransferase
MFRTHPITGDPIVFAPERSSRPGAFDGDADTSRCPFCAGHEADTPPTIAALGDPWRARVFTNKYPSVEGAEVIVESPNHDATFDRLEGTDDIVRLYVDRYRAHSGAAHVSLFKNHGPAAGASIPHIHSQVMPLPFFPPRVEREVHAFERAERCPLCMPIDGEIIRETSSFRWLAPAGSSQLYQQWIVPKRHLGEMTGFTDAEIAELATLLQSASKAMLALADSYNWLFLNFARAGAAHCYVELFPRVAKFGGFELGTGTFVQIVDPSLAAQRLRDAAGA